MRRRHRKSRATPAQRSIDMHDKITARSRRYIPAVNKVLDALDHVDLPRPVIVAIVRRELAALRESDKIVTFEDVFDHVMQALDRHLRLRPLTAINTTRAGYPTQPTPPP